MSYCTFVSFLKLPSVSYVQVEPIVVQIDRLDLVLEENDDLDAASNPSRYAVISCRDGWPSSLNSHFVPSVLVQCFDINKCWKG